MVGRLSYDGSAVEVVTSVQMEADAAQAEAAARQKIGVQAFERRRPAHRALPEHLPRERIVYCRRRYAHAAAAFSTNLASQYSATRAGRRIAEVDHSQEIIAYCRSHCCVLSYEAVAALRTHGFKARRLEEGLLESRAADRQELSRRVSQAPSLVYDAHHDAC